MTAVHSMGQAAVLAERLTTAHSDVLRELLATFIPHSDGRGGRRTVWGVLSDNPSFDRKGASDYLVLA